MKKYIILPAIFLLIGTAVYVYFGIQYKAWIDNLPNILIFIGIIAALAWALKKKEKLQQQRNNNDFE